MLLDSICKDDLTTRRRRRHLALHSLVIRTSVDLGPLFRRLEIPSLDTFEVRRVLDVKLSSTAGGKRSLTAFLKYTWITSFTLLWILMLFHDCPLNHVLPSCPNLEQLEWNGMDSSGTLLCVLSLLLNQYASTILHIGHRDINLSHSKMASQVPWPVSGAYLAGS